MIVNKNGNAFEFLIIGGGMVGLSLAYQLIKRNIGKRIIIIEKEEQLGKHSSGRNSGVLHAGLYYEPNSLKAKVCVEGSKRLKHWILDRGIRLNQCGKIIVATNPELESQLELLFDRGRQNGAVVDFISKKELHQKIPEINPSFNRALWSPNTAVVKPIDVINQLKLELIELGVIFRTSIDDWEIQDQNSLEIGDEIIKFEHLISCAGLQADKVAQKFCIGNEYQILPFKGLYWKIKTSSNFKIKTNLYPVPDLNVPFLGVHFTPSADIQPTITIGPTATFAFGRENYKGYQGIEPALAFRNLMTLGSQYFLNKGGFRRYVHEQAFLSFEPFLLKEAKKLIPSISAKDIEISEKVGIRAQLFNKKARKLENDFLCLKGPQSTHVLNAISPAFTASFELADLIIDQYLNH